MAIEERAGRMLERRMREVGVLKAAIVAGCNTLEYR